MSIYQELKGLKVKYLGLDTSGDRIQEETFYNSTDFNLKSFVATGELSIVSCFNVARGFVGGLGIQTAGLAYGGYLYVAALKNMTDRVGVRVAILNTTRSACGKEVWNSNCSSCVGGYTGTAVTNSAEHYDGCVLDGCSKLSQRNIFGCVRAGTQTVGLGLGGAAASIYRTKRNS